MLCLLKVLVLLELIKDDDYIQFLRIITPAVRRTFEVWFVRLYVAYFTIEPIKTMVLYEKLIRINQEVFCFILRIEKIFLKAFVVL